MSETNNPAAAKSRAEYEEEQRLSRDNDFRAVLQSPAGRRFIWRWLESCGLHGASFTGEALSSAHAEGKRAVAVAVVAEAQRVDSRAYVMMVEEAIAAQKRRADELEAIRLQHR